MLVKEEEIMIYFEFLLFLYPKIIIYFNYSNVIIIDYKLIYYHNIHFYLYKHKIVNLFKKNN